MSDAAASILPRKIATRAPSRTKSGFSPDMLQTFCERAGGLLGELLDTRVKVVLDSVGVEPLIDVVPDEGARVCAALIELNGMAGAATFLPDGPALFHLVDLMLGGDPEKNETVIERAPSSLSDRFCKTTADAVIRALQVASEIEIGPGACAYGGRIQIVHEGADMAIAPGRADVMTIALTVTFGPAARTGRFSMIVPLTTIDLISSGDGTGSVEPAFETGPWFEHMKTNVSLMELDTVAVLHSEQITLGDLSRLDIGSVIPLGREAVTSVRIALADGGDTIASGELGTSSGRRVISLAGPPDERFLDPLRKVIEEG